MGFYYLHINGNLIWKKIEPENDSPFVKKIWPCEVTDRKDAWTIILEGLALGARIDRIKELCNKWKCNQNDFEEMLLRIEPTTEIQLGAHIFLKNILGLNPNEYWDELSRRKDKHK